jgi:hypothetical protein
VRSKISSDVAAESPRRSPCADVSQTAEEVSKKVRFVENVQTAEPEKQGSIIRNRCKRIKCREIEKYMPPRTERDAELFLQGLCKIVAAGGFDRFSSRRNFLLDSILAGAELIPKYERWEFVVLSLLESFKQLLFLVIHLFLQIFDFNPSIIACACHTYTFSALLDRFRKLPSQQQLIGLRFVVVAIETGIEFMLTDDEVAFVTALAEHSAQAQELIGNYLKLLENPVPALLHKIASEGTCDFEFRLLAANPQLAAQLQAPFLTLLLNGNSWQRDVIVSIVSQLPADAFPTFADALLSVDGEEHESIAMPFMKLLDADWFLEAIVQKLSQLGEEKCTHALSYLHRYLQAVPPARCVQIVAMIVESVTQFLEGDIISLRRIGLVIFVELNMKIPEEFASYLAQIPTNHQRMIELYCSRRRK